MTHSLPLKWIRPATRPLRRWYSTRMALEAGTDEAGRGCLAGPVVAAAVILNPNKRIFGLNDSKKLTQEERERLAEIIKNKALAWATGMATPAEIDEVNILNASFLAMHRAVAALNLEPGLLLVDGNRFKPLPAIPHICIVKGDSKFQSIAAASILAKTHRDALMQDLHLQQPAYNWASNKGYPTLCHQVALGRYGATDQHRKTFRLQY